MGSILPQCRKALCHLHIPCSMPAEMMLSQSPFARGVLSPQQHLCASFAGFPQSSRGVNN